MAVYKKKLVIQGEGEEWLDSCMQGVAAWGLAHVKAYILQPKAT